MSKIALEGNALGSGTFTIAAPNSNSNPTLTLPTSSGTVVVTGGAQTIEFAAGSAASPSITFTGDTNTGIFSPAADTIAFAEGGAEAMRIDSDGDVGIGTTNPLAKLHITDSGNTTADGIRLTLGSEARDHNIYSDLATGRDLLIAPWRAITLKAGSGTTEGEVRLQSYESTIISTGSSYTERMRIDSSGNVGIGVTPSAWGSDTRALQIYNRTSLSDLQSTTQLTNNGHWNGSNWVYRETATAGNYNINAGEHIWRTAASGTAGNAITFTERARITSGGDFWVGATSFSNSGNGVNISASNTSGGAAGGLTVLNSASASADSSPPLVIMKAMTTTTSAARFVQFYANTSSQAMGGIVGNGATNVQFASLSDIRDKTNIQSISGSLEKINLLRPVEFDWIADGSHINAGFIAQEVETVFPEFVVENMSSDGQEDRKGLTGGMTGGIIAHLVKAIQELSAKNNALEARLAALEAK